MSKKFVLEFEEKHHILEVDGIEYEIPQRTPEIEREIKRHDEDAINNDEYDNNIRMLEILFGSVAAHQMFPDKDSTNLDKLSQCAMMAISAYYATLEDEAVRRRNEKLQNVSPIINDLEKVTAGINAVNSAKRTHKKRR